MASALSIGNEAALAAADTPYDRALLCSVAVDSLAEQLRAKSLLDATQSRALEQANSLFARELERSAGGRTAAQIEQDYEELRQSEVEGSRMVQVAIGCLRRMQ